MPQYRIVFGLPDATTTRRIKIKAMDMAEAKEKALSLRRGNEAVLFVEPIGIRESIRQVDDWRTFVDMAPSNIEISLYEQYTDAMDESEGPSEELDEPEGPLDEPEGPLDDPVVPELWDELSALLRGFA